MEVDSLYEDIDAETKERNRLQGDAAAASNGHAKRRNVGNGKICTTTGGGNNGTQAVQHVRL